MRQDDAAPWWRERRAALLAAMEGRDCAYAYDLETVRRQARRLRSLDAVSRVLYAVKANPHPAILAALAAEGLGFECVSPGEVARVRESVTGTLRESLLFTPNFAPRTEYEAALVERLALTIDNPWVLRRWGALFAGHDIFVRIDTGRAHGHHEKVRTAGAQSKFGVPLPELPELARLAEASGARVAGLHAHGGSGSVDVAHWEAAGAALLGALPLFPEARVLNLGGGLGVPESPGQPSLDLDAFGAALGRIAAASPGRALWIEPGRYLVAAAGVLLARVTQIKGKGASRYVGVATGMNSLLRPALYGARHEIVNLTRLDEPPAGRWTVVGPICESGDVLGTERELPGCEEGDVLLVANAGAYGHAMGSQYNLRAPAPELVV